MTAGPAPDAWTAALDAYEARLEAVTNAIADGDPTSVDPFLPPADLGPMPAAVQERAVALLERTHGLSRHLTRARDAVTAQLAAEPTTSRPIGGSRFDVSV